MVVSLVPEGAVVPDPELGGRAAGGRPAVQDPVAGIDEPQRLLAVALALDDLDLGRLGAAPGHLDGHLAAGAGLDPDLARQVVDGDLIVRHGVALDLLGPEAGGGEEPVSEGPAPPELGITIACMEVAP